MSGILDFDEDWNKAQQAAKEKDDATLLKTVVPMLTRAKQIRLKELLQGRGYDVRRALEYVGVLVC